MNLNRYGSVRVQNVVGQIAKKEDYFPRPDVEDALWHRVARDSVLLLAPRRVGKSSLLCRMRDEPRPSWKVLYTDVQSVEDEPAFVARLLEALRTTDSSGKRVLRTVGEKIDLFSQRFQGVNIAALGGLELREAIKPSWREFGKQLLETLGQSDQKILVQIDEFPILIQRLLTSGGRGITEDGLTRARTLLEWFRSVRLSLSASGSPVRFLLAGSIGLDGLTREAGLSGSINDLATERLGPLEPDEAARLLHCLCEGESVPLDDETRAAMLERLDWQVPFHLQLLFEGVARLIKFKRRSSEPRLVVEAWDALLGPENRKHFSHWEERLDNPLWEPHQQKLAGAILWAAALDPKGVSGATIQQLRIRHAQGIDERLILDTLEHDGYLMRSADRWRFASSLLRAWWLRHKSEQEL